MISAVLVLIFGFVYGPEYFMPHLQPEERINLIKLKYWLTILVFLGMSGIGGKYFCLQFTPMNFVFVIY